MTKKRRLEFLLCIGIIWTATALQAYSLSRWEEEDKLLESFDVLEAVPVECCIEMTAPLNQIYLNQEEKKQVLEQFGADLGVTDGYELESEESDQVDSLILKKKGNIGEMQISITTLSVEMENQQQKLNQYLYVMYRAEKKMDRMLLCKEKIEKVFQNWNLDATSNLNLKGEKQGDLTLEEKEQLAQKLFYYLEAKEVESVKEEELFTIYGYSDLLKDSVAYGDRQINLNLVFSYDEERKVTEFLLAMPYAR